MAGRPAYAAKTAEPAKPSLVKRLVKFILKKPIAIIGTLALAAATAVVVSVVPTLFNQAYDSPNWLDELRPGPEIQVTVSKVWLNDEGRTMVTPPGLLPNEDLGLALSRPGAAADDSVLRRIEESGGVRAERLTLQLVLEGRRSQQIRITGIDPVIEEESEPLAGTLFDIPSQAGDASLRLLLNLDEDRPVAREAQVDEISFELKPGRPYFDANTISLKDGEQQVVVLRAQTSEHFFTFRVRIMYLIGGETRTAIVGDGDKPFAVTAVHYGPEPSARPYEHVLTLDNDFSLCEVSDPSRVPGVPTC